MDGPWVGRRVRHGAMAIGTEAFFAMMEYDGNDPTSGHDSDLQE